MWSRESALYEGLTELLIESKICVRKMIPRGTCRFTPEFIHFKTSALRELTFYDNISRWDLLILRSRRLHELIFHTSELILSIFTYHKCVKYEGACVFVRINFFSFY